MEEVEFPIGRLRITRGVTASVSEGVILNCLHRHQSDDRGEVPASEEAPANGAPSAANEIISQYDGGGVRFWIITNRRRRETVVFLPSEEE